MLELVSSLLVKGYNWHLSMKIFTLVFASKIFVRGVAKEHFAYVQIL